jgi:trimeric autotransporter adhesin
LGSYDYLDKSPIKGANQYRLKIEDLNGNISYSNVVTVMYSNTGVLTTDNILVYPNPTRGALNLNITAPNTTSLIYNIKIVNATGLIMKSATTMLQNWQTNVSALLPGSYIVLVTDKNDNLIGRGTFVKL